MLLDWFKKSGENSLDIKLNKVNDHLKNSFNLVKKDIHEIGFWIKELHEKSESHHSKFDLHEKRLNQIEKRLEEIYFLVSDKEPIKEEGEEESFQFNQTANSFSSLRLSEKDVFQKLMKLVRERGKSIHLKDLAAEVYPGKDYEKVRTALANHISALEMFGFLYRQRIGREVYIDLTEEGKKFVRQVDIELKKGKKVYIKSKIR